MIKMIQRLFQLSSKTTEFPVFTICPQYEKGYKKTILMDKYNATVKEIRQLKYPNVANTRKFFYEVTYNLTEIVKSVRFITTVKSDSLRLNIHHRGIEASDGQNFSHEEIFENINWISFGQCFTLKGKPNKIKMLTVIGIINLHIDFASKSN